MDFMVQQCRWAKDICAMEDGDQPRQQCLGAKLLKAYTSFCDFFNGQWWETAVWTHHCSRDGSCCKGLTDAERFQDALRRGTDLVLQCLLRRKPCRMAKNKWTKLLPSFDFFILGQTPHKMLHQLSRAAMGPLVSEYTAGAGRQSDPERMAFHRIAGQRLQRVFSILDSDDVAFSHMVIEIVNEPGRELTMFFMEAAEGSVRSHGHPHLMDVALPEASGILASLQYFSGLLFGDPATTRLIWQRCGHPSFGSWAKAKKVQALKLLRAVLQAAASIQKRFKHFQEPPYNLVTLADGRASVDYKERIITQFEAAGLANHCMM